MSNKVPGVETVFGNRIFVTETEVEKIGSLFIPTTVEKDHRVCTVHGVGEGRTFADGSVVPHPVAPGDLVLCEARAAYEVSVGGTKYLVYRMDDIIAKLDKNMFT